MSSIKVEEIDQIDLSQKNWWQPKIDRKEYKEICKRSNSKAWFHTILYFSVLIFTGYLAVISWGTFYAVPALFFIDVLNKIGVGSLSFFQLPRTLI